MPNEQEQNTVQTQDTEDYAAYLASRGADADQSGAGEETPVAESAEESETSKKQEPEKPKDDPEGEDPEESEEEKPRDGEERPKRGKGGFQRKIDKLTARNRALEERLAALEKTSPAKEATADAATDDPEPKEEDFENFSDYVKATTKWTYRQEQKAKTDSEAEEKAKADAESRKQKAAEGWNERVAEARKQFEDYDEVLEEAADIEVSSDLEAALLEAGPAVIYHLAKNRDEAERIAKLPTSTALREIGKIEAKLTAAPAKEPTPKPQTKKTTSAPKPAAPIPGGSGATPTIYDSDIGEDIAEYRARRRNSR